MKSAAQRRPSRYNPAPAAHLERPEDSDLLVLPRRGNLRADPFGCVIVSHDRIHRIDDALI